jgi:uridine kinase
MDNTIEIRVVGRAMSGKTSIAQEIVDALRQLNFNVEWDVSPDYHYEGKARKEGGDRLDRLAKTRNNEPKIIVKEIQAAREIKY